jgi:hypothetical protein
MAYARTDARSDGRLSSGAMAKYIGFYTRASDRAPGRRARPLCLSGAALEPQRSRGAKLLHLSWEMRVGRATRVSRAGLARLISWRMNEFSASRLQRRRLCKRVVRLVSTGLADGYAISSYRLNTISEDGRCHAWRWHSPARLVRLSEGLLVQLALEHWLAFAGNMMESGDGMSEMLVRQDMAIYPIWANNKDATRVKLNALSWALLN